MKSKALEVILELHAWIDANDVGTTRWIAKGDVNRKKVCRVVAVMSTETAITTATAIFTATVITSATKISIETTICMEKSTECSANVITNTGKTPIAVESAVFILFSSTM